MPLVIGEDPSEDMLYSVEFRVESAAGFLMRR